MPKKFERKSVQATKSQFSSRIYFYKKKPEIRNFGGKSVKNTKEEGCFKHEESTFDIKNKARNQLATIIYLKTSHRAENSQTVIFGPLWSDPFWSDSVFQVALQVKESGRARAFGRRPLMIFGFQTNSKRLFCNFTQIKITTGNYRFYIFFSWKKSHIAENANR